MCVCLSTCNSHLGVFRCLFMSATARRYQTFCGRCCNSNFVIAVVVADPSATTATTTTTTTTIATAARMLLLFLPLLLLLKPTTVTLHYFWHGKACRRPTCLFGPQSADLVGPVGSPLGGKEALLRSNRPSTATLIEQSNDGPHLWALRPDGRFGKLQAC